MADEKNESATPASSGRPMSKLEAARAAKATAKAEAAGGQNPAATAKAEAGASGESPSAKPMSKLEAAKAAAAAKGGGGAPATSKLAAAKAAGASKSAGGEGAAAAAAKGTSAAAVAEKPAPVKPPVKPAAKAVKAEEGRRFFLFTWIGAAWAAFTAAMAGMVLGTARFMFPNVIAEPPSTVKVGPPDRFDEGQVSEDWKNEFGFWVCRAMVDGKDEIYALKSVCTHLGCTPNWLEAEQKFKCPCHGSGFYKSGVNFEGPAPRPLERYRIYLDGADNQVTIDKSKIFQRELGQWTETDSFIPV